MGEDGAESVELVDVGRDQFREPSTSAGGQPQPNRSVILGVDLALDEPGPNGTVNETDHTVVSQEQVICHITDGGRAAEDARRFA